MAATVSLGDHRLEVFAPSPLCVWSQMPWRNQPIRVSLRGFLLEFLRKFDGWEESVMFSSKTILSLPKNFLHFWFDAVE